MNIIRPVIYMGQELKDYGVDSKTGDIYSFKTGKPYKLKWHHRNRKNLKISYPSVSLIDKEVFKENCQNSLTINVHILVHETLCPLPSTPNDVTKKEWRTTPNSVKKVCRGLWVVNHKDHNKTNYNPKNLEWVTIKGNAEAAKKYYS